MYDTTIVGAGIAGIEAAINLAQNGYKTLLIEKDKTPGGHLKQWDKLFPFQENADNIINPKIQTLTQLENLTIKCNTTLKEATKHANHHTLTLSTDEQIDTRTILLTTGYRIFNASRKEEYGFGIYDNVTTSAELEKLLKQNQKPTRKDGKELKRIVFVHCVGSRDEKVCNRHCSKLCCITAVKQACELKELYPESEIYCLYMDLRMFERHFENMYLTAQKQYNIHFLRGRLSEAAEDFDGTVRIKAEDTLMGQQIKMGVDLLVLMVGMEASDDSETIAQMLNLTTGTDRFYNVDNPYTLSTQSRVPNIFFAGTCTGPKSIPETVAEARSATIAIQDFLKQNPL